MCPGFKAACVWTQCKFASVQSLIPAGRALWPHSLAPNLGAQIAVLSLLAICLSIIDALECSPSNLQTILKLQSQTCIKVSFTEILRSGVKASHLFCGADIPQRWRTFSVFGGRLRSYWGLHEAQVSRTTVTKGMMRNITKQAFKSPKRRTTTGGVLFSFQLGGGRCDWQAMAGTLLKMGLLVQRWQTSDTRGCCLEEVAG